MNYLHTSAPDIADIATFSVNLSSVSNALASQPQDCSCDAERVANLTEGWIIDTL